MTHQDRLSQSALPSRRGPAVALLAATLLLFSAPALADARFGDQIEVEEVLLDVLVTDRNGKPIVGLDEDDFIVREGGEPAEIRDVSFFTNDIFREASEIYRGESDSELSNRYFILFFHHQQTLLPRLRANLLDAGHRAKQWVSSSLHPNDYVAVVSYFPKYNLLDFTNETQLVTRAIDEAVQGKDFTLVKNERPLGIPSLAAHLPQIDVDRIYDALSVTAEAAKEVRGRTNLVLFSIGFGEVDRFGFYRPDKRYYPEMIRTLNENRVAVYPVDLLATDLSPFFRLNRFDNVLSRIATESGGQFFYNFNNYLTPLEEIAEDASGYYLISFTPNGDTKPGEYRKVSVETLSSNLEIRARDGYTIGDTYPRSEDHASSGQ